MVWQLKSCCCLCSLRAGALIIAIVSIILSLALLMFWIPGVSLTSDYMRFILAKDLKKHAELDPIIPDNLDFQGAIDSLKRKNPSKDIIIISTISAIFLSFYLIMNILLLFGIIGERHRLVKTWINHAVLQAIVYIVLSLLSWFLFFYYVGTIAGCIILVSTSSFVALEIYCILVVNSFRTELVSANFQNKDSMMMLHFKSCCCACSLKTGTIIIAVLAAIYALAVLVVSILAASAQSGELQKYLESIRNKEFPPFYEVIYMDNQFTVHQINIFISRARLAISMFICTAIVMFFYMIVSILLIFGASAERHRLVKAWIICAVLHLIAYATLAVMCIIRSFGDQFVLPGFMALVFVVLDMYFILVVNSFHTELLSTNIENTI